MKLDPQKFGKRLLLAVSGGADSLVMARLFLNSGADFAVAHCNFHLRGAESDEDSLFVQKWCSDNGITCHVRDFDTLEFARVNKLSIEMAARELRYRWFDSLCNEYGFDGVCVAHNANDNAETLILNLLRGSGLKGLCGIARKSVNPYGTSLVFRPMLDFSRAQIEEYAAKKGLNYRTDSTNLKNDCRRNIVRNEIFPLFAGINPSYLSSLNADIARFIEAQSMVDEYVAQYKHIKWPVISIKELKSCKHWQYLLYVLMSEQGFNPAVIEDLTQLLSGDGVVAGRRFVSSERVVETSSGELHLIEAPAPVVMPVVELLPWHRGDNPRTERGVILVDAAKLGSEPEFRLWKEGDWLRPIGLKGKKKVSDMLTDLKYTISEKESVLVVSSGASNHVLAVVGERIDETVAVTETTERVYRISISKGSLA